MKTNPNRRTFIRNIAAVTAFPLAVPAFAAVAKPDVAPLPDTPLKDEAFWEMVKAQFAVPDDHLMMNAANLCPSPYFIHQKVNDLNEQLSKDVSFHFRSRFTESRKTAIQHLARLINADTEEVGITRNTSESNGMIISGLDLKAGDEVVIWDQNHPSNGVLWEQQAKRKGFLVKKVTVPANPSSASELTLAFEKAIGPKTKVLAFSHISNTSGIALDAAAICRMARSRNVLTLVDGAQSLGAIQIDVKQLQCDFYSASTHKWLMGPMENGVLFIRRELLGQVAPSIAGGGWREGGHTVDEKLCVLGQRNDPSTAVLADCVAFHQKIGVAEVEKRVKELSAYLKRQLQDRVPGLTFVTPLPPELSAGVVIFNVEGKDPGVIYNTLYEKHRIASAPSGGVRLSPHIYNTKRDIDTVVDAVRGMA